MFENSLFFGYNTRNSSEQNSDVRDRRQFLQFAPKMKIFMWLNKCYKTNEKNYNIRLDPFLQQRFYVNYNKCSM